MMINRKEGFETVYTLLSTNSSEMKLGFVKTDIVSWEKQIKLGFVETDIVSWEKQNKQDPMISFSLPGLFPKKGSESIKWIFGNFHINDNWDNSTFNIKVFDSLGKIFNFSESGQVVETT